MRYRSGLCAMRRVAVVACGGVLSLLFARPAVSQQSKTLPVFVDGQTQIVPGFQDPAQWIHQDLWVETEFDSDHDGKRDRVHVDVTRPRQTETEGLKVPVIYESSPYYPIYHGERPDIPNWDLQEAVDTVPPRRVWSPLPFTATYTHISASFVKDWVARGFAVVHSESPGTGLSQGCPTVGGDNEALAPKAVIEWLNGRARGFTTADGDEQVVASWSTGKVGMLGASYDGTLALAAATTGVDGLKAIIPVSPVSSFYEYYRSNGLVRSPGGYPGEDIDVLFDFINTGHRNSYCAATVRDSVLIPGQERTDGDYNAFWATRDYLANVTHIKAAVLVAHGFGDWNTMPDQAARLYEGLKERHLPVHAYWNQGGHGAFPPDFMINRWFTHYLYGVNNGVDKEPPVWIVREGADEADPTSYADYPNPAAAAVTLYLQAGGRGIGGLGVVHRAGQGKQTLTDDVALSTGVLVHAAQDSHRLLYATPVLTDTVHLSGWSTITMRLAASRPAANLSVYLVALPAIVDSASKVQLITRGWADPQNYRSLTHGEPLVPGQFYPLHFNLEPTDRVVPAGMRIALMIFASDRGFTVWPNPGTDLTIDVDATSVVLPVVGGTVGLERAFGAARP